ncbi:hypothetical protein [Bdellovibrio bacteriovorus]|uniref:hypothetical protein n=1 Tax=Bdellovibrio TaxID=958 RepID=UPI0035A9A0D6
MNKKIIISCIIGLSLVSLFLAKEYLFKATVSEQSLGVPLAEVKDIQNELRYKHASNVFWDQAAKTQKLYNGSEIFTGSSSQALLEMKNKDLIRVPQETLLRITEDAKSPGQLALNLEKGSLRIEGGKDSKGLKLRVGNENLEFSPQGSFGLFVKKEENGELSVSVASGSLSVKNGDQTKSLGVGQAIRLKAPSAEAAVPPSPSQSASPTTTELGHSGENDKAASEQKNPKVQLTEVEGNKIELIYPPSNKILYGQGLEFFKWKTHSNKKLELEYSKSSDFMTDTQKIDVSGLSDSVIPRDLQTGEYFWRVISFDNEIPQFSETWSFRVEGLKGSEAQPAQLVFKERGKWNLVVPVKDAKPQEKYHFQVSKKKDFSEIYDEYEGSSPLKTLIEEPGEFHVRLRKAFNGGAYSDWSKPVQQTVRPPLDQPLLNKGEERLGASEQVEMHLNWQEIPYATDYLVQLADTPKFGNVLKNIIVAKPPYLFRHSESKPGFLRVIGRSVEGEYSPSSQVYQVKGLVRGPAIEKKEVLPSLFETQDSSPQFHLLWGHRSQAKKYRIELSRDAKLADAENLETDNVEIFRNVSAEGWYYFRVWPVGDAEKYFFIPTPILAVSFAKPGNLIQPKVMTPKKNEVFLVPRGVPVSIKFSWSESPENEWYVLQMAQNPSFNSPIEEKIQAQEYVLKKPIPNGQWYFRIRGRNKYQASNWSDTGVFYFGVSQ